MPSISESLIIYLALSTLIIPFLAVPMVMIARGRRADEQEAARAAELRSDASPTSED